MIDEDVLDAVERAFNVGVYGNGVAGQGINRHLAPRVIGVHPDGAVRCFSGLTKDCSFRGLTGRCSGGV